MACLAAVQLEVAQGRFWATVLIMSRALHRLAAAADPLIPWLAQEAAERTPLLEGIRCGSATVAQVPGQCEWTAHLHRGSLTLLAFVIDHIAFAFHDQAHTPARALAPPGQMIGAI